THLAPGTYVFRVQGSNSVGVWNEEPVEMTIVIHPPWWRSNPAYVAYALLVIFAVWQTWRFQVNRVKMKAQLAYEQRETERVKAMEQLKTDFFSNITHEFRTPLSLILEPARRIMAQTTDPGIRENANRVETNSLRLLNMVNQLLDLAKIEHKNMGLDLRHGDLGEAVGKTFNSFLPLAEKRGIHLTLSLGKNIPPFLFDPDKTELILNNLLSNALKFTPKGGTVEVSLESNQEAMGGVGLSTVIKVKDTGIGIPAGALAKVFDRFYQVQEEVLPLKKGAPVQQIPGSDQPASKGGVLDGVSADGANADQDPDNPAKTAGTGIGLALSKELVELMGGGIAVESEVGRGSTFSFWLPMTALTPTDAPLPEKETALLSLSSEERSRYSPSDFLPGIPGYGESGKEMDKASAIGEAGASVALIIEDNVELRDFIKQSISAHWQVEEASDGEEGIQKAIELVPDLVISDLMMPGKDGYAVCEALKANEITAHIPVILLTARASMDSKLKGLQKGADDYLTKPFNTEELLVRMSNLVEMRQKLRAHYGKLPLGTALSDSDGGSDYLSNPDKEFLRRFVEVLDNNLENDMLGVEEFAQKMFISRSQLHRKLKALTDQNATDFIRDYRLERAMEMLKNQEGLVIEIASRVGFSNEKYFSTAFKEKFGLSPSRV
ncbi:MAG: response regulator, partial [Saprospiraceae bacterium]|nr:response regulator [Saprospiraceae bacterium]